MPFLMCCTQENDYKTSTLETSEQAPPLASMLITLLEEHTLLSLDDASKCLDLQLTDSGASTMMTSILLLLAFMMIVLLLLLLFTMLLHPHHLLLCISNMEFGCHWPGMTNFGDSSLVVSPEFAIVASLWNFGMHNMTILVWNFSTLQGTSEGGLICWLNGEVVHKILSLQDLAW